MVLSTVNLQFWGQFAPIYLFVLTQISGLQSCDPWQFCCPEPAWLLRFCYSRSRKPESHACQYGQLVVLKRPFSSLTRNFHPGSHGSKQTAQGIVGTILTWPLPRGPHLSLLELSPMSVSASLLESWPLPRFYRSPALNLTSRPSIHSFQRPWLHWPPIALGKPLS